MLLPYELQQQRAHVTALTAAAILTHDEQQQVLPALHQLAQQWCGKPCPDSPAEDLHTWVELQLTEQLGAVGRKIHTARSRNDQVATVLKLYVMDQAKQLSGALAELIKRCARQAEKWSELICPLQTHSQFAAPGSMGLWILRHGLALQRVRELLHLHYAQWKRFCPLGSGAVAGSSIPLDRRIQAQELGFDQPSLNALDSTSTRDECLDLLAMIGRIGLHLQTLATDVVSFAQTAHRWVIYPRAFGTGSSMLPNKINPDAMELIRGQCSLLMNSHNEALLLLKGLPTGYQRDLQCLKPVLIRNVLQAMQIIELMSAFIEELKFDTQRLRVHLLNGGIDALWRMEEKVLAGMPLRDAHHAVATELAGSNGHHAPLDSTDLYRYRTSGSAHPDETRQVAWQLLADAERE
ncbi:MAG: Argininosuccinate lyase [Phycisphaerae bacterium]|nr:Argininosuccinate lyase [Phycisphaerae bacterium]